MADIGVCLETESLTSVSCRADSTAVCVVALGVRSTLSIASRDRPVGMQLSLHNSWNLPHMGQIIDSYYSS